MDIARGLTVGIGRFHVSGCLSMLDDEHAPHGLACSRSRPVDPYGALPPGISQSLQQAIPGRLPMQVRPLI
jgi:hypothetical protein